MLCPLVCLISLLIICEPCSAHQSIHIQSKLFCHMINVICIAVNLWTLLTCLLTVDVDVFDFGRWTSQQLAPETVTTNDDHVDGGNGDIHGAETVQNEETDQSSLCIQSPTTSDGNSYAMTDAIDDILANISYLLSVNGCHLWFMTYAGMGQHSHSSLYVLYDPGYMGVAVGISLLSCMRAEIYVISYPFPVSCRHVCFTTYPDIEQQHYFYCVFYATENVLLPLKSCCYHIY